MPAMSDAPSPKRYRLPRSMRLRGRRAIDAVFAAKMRKNVGPLSVLGRPNEEGVLRFAISIGRRAGTAPKRNRIKRLIREAMRLMQHDFPRGYDLVIVIRPHETATLAEYQRMLFKAAGDVVRGWRKRLESA